MLGRRLERLFFAALVIMVLVFGAVLLALINKQLAEDHSDSAVRLLLEQLQSSEEHLTSLFTTPNPEPLRPPVQDPDRLRKINATRRKLGLPPESPEAPPAPSPPRQTYADALREIQTNVALRSHVKDTEVASYLDLKKAPAELIKALEARLKELEAQPTSLFGMRTPRSLRLKYFEQEYDVPYGLLSTMLVFPLALLIAGWCLTTYMTRKRELIIIRGLIDYKAAFPHVLNVLPMWLRLVRPDGSTRLPEPTPRDRRFFQIVMGLGRTFVILLLTVPMIGGFAYSIYILEQVEGETWPGVLATATALCFLMAIQALLLVAQDWVLLWDKYFEVKSRSL